MRNIPEKLRSMTGGRHIIAVTFAIALCTACTPYQQLLFSLVPDGTIPMLLSHFERVDDTNRRRVMEFEQRKDWDGLAKFAEEHLKAEKSNSDWWTIAGYAYSQAGNYKRAIECYGEAVRLTPDDMVAWNLLAQSYRSAGQPERALQIANRALNIKSDSSQTWYLVGELNGDLGRYVPAANAYGESIKLDEGFAPAWLGLGKVYARLGRTAELKKVAETLRQLDPALARELAAFTAK
jgi:tetratricopeptide (TPR) repeat protein